MAESTAERERDFQTVKPVMEIMRAETGTETMIEKGSTNQREFGGTTAQMEVTPGQWHLTTTPNTPILLTLLPPMLIPMVHIHTHNPLHIPCHHVGTPLPHSRDMAPRAPRGVQNEATPNVMRRMVVMIFTPSGHMMWSTEQKEDGVAMRSGQEYFQNQTPRKLLKAGMILNRKKRVQL